MQLEQTLINLIKDHLQIERAVEPENKLIDIGYDSLKFIELVIKAEASFNIEFEDEYLNYHRFETIRQVADYIVSRGNMIIQ
jgi:acyl carrier protein